MGNLFKNPRKLIRLAAILVLVVVGGIYVQRFISGMMAQKNNQGAKDLYYHEESGQDRRPVPGQEDSIGDDHAEESFVDPLDENGIAVDFHELLKVNPDIVGWITVADRIDFPVVHGDNDYYLYHDYKKEEDPNGSIFLNSINHLDPRDDILMIFGHDMTSGAMFAPLMSYMNYDHLCQYPVITFRTIYDPQDVYYTPVAAIDASMIRASSIYFDIMRINFVDDIDQTDEAVNSGDTGLDNDINHSGDGIGIDQAEQSENGRRSQEFQKYLDDSASRSVWTAAVDYSVSDQYILLVTCSYNSRDDDRRFCLLCRMLRPDETPEIIRNKYMQK